MAKNPAKQSDKNLVEGDDGSVDTNAQMGQPGDFGTSGFALVVDWMIVFCLGFAVPLASLFRGHWLEYFLPVGLFFTILHLKRYDVSWRDYVAVIPRIAFVFVGALIVLGLIAALRVFDLITPVEQAKFITAPFILYFAFYGVMFFIMIRGTALAKKVLWGMFFGALVAYFLLVMEPAVGLVSEGLFPLTHKTGFYNPSHLNRTFLALSLVAWLAAPWLAKRYGSALYGLLLPLAIWLLNFSGESETVLIGMAPALVVYLLAVWLPRFTLHGVFGVVLLLLFAAPVIYPHIFQLSLNLPPTDKLGILVRTEIWDAVSGFIGQSPLIGHGMQATQHTSSIEMANLYYPDTLINHPHNAFLQVWADLGLLGTMALAGIFWSLWRWIGKLDNADLPAVLAVFTFATAALISTYSLWAPWWLGLLAMTIAYCIVATGASKAAEASE